MKKTSGVGAVLVACFALLPLACAAAPDEDERPELTGQVASALGEAGTIKGHAGQCLDIQWGSSTPGTPVWMWTCNGGSAQQWYMTSTNEIRVRDFGDRCLTVSGGAGSTPYIGSCTGAPNQKWTLLQDGSLRSGWDGSLCLDVAYGGSSPGTRVGLTYCNPALPSWSPQVWNFQRWSSKIGAGQWIPEGQEIRSDNGSYRLIMQYDCNLVVYAGTTAIWSSNTAGHNTGCLAVMQSDGNFVVYGGDGGVVWSSDTWRPPRYEHGAIAVLDSWIELQDDNNLVLRQRICRKCGASLGSCQTVVRWSSRSGWSNGDPIVLSACSGGGGSDCVGGLRCVAYGSGFSCAPC